MGKFLRSHQRSKRGGDALREYRLALLQATDACKNQLPQCAGGEYGPPSPRLAESPPSYLTGGINRIYGPEDLGLSTRCLGAQLPDFAYVTMHLKYSRIVQSPERVSIYYDTGMGQGWQRIIPVNGGPHLPPSVPSAVRGLTRPLGGHDAGRRRDQFQRQVGLLRIPRELASRRTFLHASMRTRSSTLSRSTIPTTWTRPWTVRQENEQAG